MAPPPKESDSTHPGLAEPRTKEDWFAYVFYEPPPRPRLPRYDAYVAMAEDDPERRRLIRSRNRYHSALVLAWTPSVQYVESEITELLDANEMAPPGARLGLLIDGPPTVGKSTLVKMIGRKFEQDGIITSLTRDFPVLMFLSPDRELDTNTGEYFFTGQFYADFGTKRVTTATEDAPVRMTQSSKAGSRRCRRTKSYRRGGGGARRRGDRAVRV
jgi:hypothetical protein